MTVLVQIVMFTSNFLVSENPGKKFLSTFCGVPVFFGMYLYYKIRYSTKLVDLQTVDLNVGEF